MSDLHTRRYTEQRLQFNHTGSQPPSGYWDNLSKIWLTKRALKELNRRNNKPNEHSPPYRRNRRPFTRSLFAKWAKGQQSASEILYSYSEDDLKEVQRFARQGGPDTSNLRGVFIARCSCFTRMLMIRPRIQNLAILLNTLRCHLRTAYLPRRTKTLPIQQRPRIQALTLATSSKYLLIMGCFPPSMSIQMVECLRNRIIGTRLKKE
jgi:hypothetical protein